MKIEIGYTNEYKQNDQAKRKKYFSKETYYLIRISFKITLLFRRDLKSAYNIFSFICKNTGIFNDLKKLY